jgi:hypothetical protein
MYFMTPGHRDSPPYDGYYKMLTSGYTAFGVSLTQIEVALAKSQDALQEAVGRPTRWFDSYEQLVKQVAGKKRLAQIRREAANQGISAEQLCEDYVEYSILRVPDHFQVRDSEYSVI